MNASAPIQKSTALGEHLSPKTRVWRYALLVLFVPAIAAAVALFASQNRSLQYESDAALIVTFGEEYISRPLAGDSESWAPWSDQVAVNSELAILNSDSLRDRVIKSIGVPRILGEEEPAKLAATSAFSDLRFWLKEIAKKAGISESEHDEMTRAQQAWDNSVNVKVVKDTSVIYVSYRHDSPEAAKEVVDRLLDQYFDMRRGIYAKADDQVSGPQLLLRKQEYETAALDMKKFATRVGGEDFPTLLNSATQDSVSLRTIIANLDREIANRGGTLASAEVASSTGPGLSEVLRSNASLAGLKAERQEAARQLGVIEDRLHALSNMSAEYAVLEQQLEFAREAFRSALTRAWEAQVDTARANAQPPSVKILQAGTLPRSAVNLSSGTLVTLSAGLALVTVLIGLILFVGRDAKAIVRATA